MVELSLFVASVDGTVDGVVTALASFADTDCDFNGENGLGYVSQEAQDAGFDSNLEYACNLAMREKTPMAAIELFTEMWLAHDNYYQDWKVNVDDSEGEITSIALAFNVKC